MNHDQFWSELAGDLGREFRAYRSRLGHLDVSVKPDKTLLTEADTTVQSLIIDRIRKIDPYPVIVAEEDERTTVRKEVLDNPGRVWVIDPIDGTAEFVKPRGREFCSVVCLLEDLVPTAAFVLAPELGAGSTPIAITASARDSVITINGNAASRSTSARWVSVTRSKGTSAKAFEAGLADMG